MCSVRTKCTPGVQETRISGSMGAGALERDRRRVNRTLPATEGLLDVRPPIYPHTRERVPWREGTVSTPLRSETNTEIVRLNVNLNAETADALKKLAEGSNLSLTEVVRRAISLYNFIEGERKQGHRIQTADPDRGEVRELVLM